mgnify:FL=1
MKRSLDLFCGTKSFSKVAERYGYETTTLDILQEFLPTHCCDILDWDYKQYPVGHFDIIWASPNCKDYSKMNFLSGKDKDLTESNNLIKKTIEIIKYFNPDYWFLENPATGKLVYQEFMDFIPFTDIDYCKYGFDIRKRTRIWNNLLWDAQPPCCKGHYCKNKERDKVHTEMNWITRGGGSSKWEKRIMIPSKLIEEIIQSCGS